MESMSSTQMLVIAAACLVGASCVWSAIYGWQHSPLGGDRAVEYVGVTDETGPPDAAW